MAMKLTGHTLLCYRLNTPLGKQMKSVALLLGIRVRSVDESQYGEALGSLVGQPDLPRPEETEEERQTEISEEMMVLCGFNHQTLDLFLNQLRSRGIPRVELKAVLTEHNRNWSSRQLFCQLCQEREAFSRVQSGKSV